MITKPANLKITDTHFAQLYEAMKDAAQRGVERNADRGITCYADIEAHYVKNVNSSDPAMRCRWDMFHTAVFNGCSRRDFVCHRETGLYAYLNDSHIDSALKVIVRALKAENV